MKKRQIKSQIKIKLSNDQSQLSRQPTVPAPDQTLKSQDLDLAKNLDAIT